MGKLKWLVALVVVVCVLLVLAYGLTHASISALPNPGPIETSWSGAARDWFISRGARGVPRPSVANNAKSISEGGNLFGTDCSTCHGENGRKPTQLGRAMYPRALDLGSQEVQKLSNRELFWTIKNGIRLSGMPGFAGIESDPEIWQLTYYVRSLGKGGTK